MLLLHFLENLYLFIIFAVSSQNVGAYPCRLAPACSRRAYPCRLAPACSRHERCGRPVGQAQGAAPTPNYWDDTLRAQKNKKFLKSVKICSIR